MRSTGARAPQRLAGRAGQARCYYFTRSYTVLPVMGEVLDLLNNEEGMHSCTEPNIRTPVSRHQKEETMGTLNSVVDDSAGGCGQPADACEPSEAPETRRRSQRPFEEPDPFGSPADPTSWPPGGDEAPAGERSRATAERA